MLLHGIPYIVLQVNTFGTYFSIRYGQCSYDEQIENITSFDAGELAADAANVCGVSLIALCFLNMLYSKRLK